MGTLTATAIKALVKRGQPGRYADGDGLFLEIRSNTSYYWLLRIQARGRRHEFGLGSGRKVPLALARERAAVHIETIMRGGDPTTRGRQVRVAAPTFKDVATECIAEHIKTLTNAKVKMQWTNRMVAYVYPHIGGMPVDRIETRDVMRALSPIWTTKPETARRLRQRIGKVLDYAKLHGHRTGDNPVDVIMNGKGLSPQNQVVRHHPALPYKDVNQFVADVQASSAECITKLALEFLILTASRVQEAIGARWEEVDWEARTWTVPGSRMKAKKPHVVPLSERAMAILNKAKLIGATEYVFPSPNKRHSPLSTGAFDKRIDLMKRTGKVTAHGFRSTFRDWAAEEANFPHEVVEMALAHAIKSAVEAAYRRGDLLEKRRVLMQAWADYVTGHVASTNNVLQLKAS